MTSSWAGCVSRAKAGVPSRAPGCFAWWAWDNWKAMSLVAELRESGRPSGGRRAVSRVARRDNLKSMSLVSQLLGNLAPHGVDDVTLTCSLLACLLDDCVNDLPKIRYPGKIE